MSMKLLTSRPVPKLVPLDENDLTMRIKSLLMGEVPLSRLGWQFYCTVKRA